MNFQLKSFGIFLLVWNSQHLFTFADSVCYSCDSKNSPNECFGLTDNSIVSTCQTSFDKCYTVIVDDVLYRGCVGDAQFPNEESIEKCSNPSLCQICSDTNQCNSNLITDVCLKCGGTGSNSSSTCDKQETDKYLIVPCSLKNDEQSNRCFFKVTNDTFAKGCMRHLSSIEQKQCQQQSKACYSCSSPNCNQNINVCYECNGENNLNCTDKIDTENNTTRIICSDESMACVTGIDANGFTHRGCFSIDGLGSTFPFGFTNCSTSLCNNRIFPSNRLTCYQCEGDIECKTLENLRPAICNNFVDQCYTYLDGGGTFYRGCMKENSKGKSLCEQNAAKCDVCDERGCNFLDKSKMNASNKNKSDFQILYSLILFVILNRFL